MTAKSNLMVALNLPPYPGKLRRNEEHIEVFDPIRKKWIILTPEEWVRQHFINYLLEEKKVPKSLIKVEGGLKFNQLQKRSDILVYDRHGKPVLLIECKSPNVVLSSKTFEQAAVYNTSYRVLYMGISNGIDHYYCRMDYENNSFSYLKDLPEFDAMISETSSEK